MNLSTRRAFISFLVSAAVVAAALLLNVFFGGLAPLPGPLPLLLLVAVVAAIWCATTVLMLGTMWLLQRRGRPEAEAVMIGRLYRLLSIVVIVLALAYGYGKLGTFGTLFSLFGGMLLGWSLQAPVSGFAAWVLVSLKRPFRPGDRIQFPNLGLTGDVVDIGAMYVVLDQVAQRITTEGLLQPIIVRPRGDGSSYDIIAGHLRFEACKRLGWKTIPAVVQAQQQAGPSTADPAGVTDPLIVAVKPARQEDGGRGKGLPPAP